MDHIFGVDSRALKSVRVCGYTCSAADSIISSVEYELDVRRRLGTLVPSECRPPGACCTARYIR